MPRSRKIPRLAWGARGSRLRRQTYAVAVAATIAGAGLLPLCASSAGAVAPYTEKYRPQFHYTPAKHWMNDPNGLVYSAGQYHLYYQYNPSGSTWGNMSWGHASSPDLVHWTELPVAIPEDASTMIFSGSAVVDTNNTSGLGSPDDPAMVAIYTAVNKSTGNQSQSLAYSTDGGTTFVKYSGNPVLDIDSNNFRDPKVFWYAPGNVWLMVAALSDQHKITFYSSPDLKSWTHLSDFGPAGATGGPWECPDLFALPDPADPTKLKWVLLVSLNPGGVAGGSGTQYFIGRFDGTTFRPDGLLPAGSSLGTFDTGWARWMATGPAFGSTPATKTLPSQLPVSGWEGAGYASSFHGGDASVGQLSSPSFTINHRYLNFLAGGGEHPYVPGSVGPEGLPDGAPFADFDGSTFGDGWQATGDLVRTGPAAGTLPGQNTVSNYRGTGLVNTFTNGDGPTGTITSAPFTLSRRYVNLLVGGGNHPWGEPDPTSVNLIVDGQVVATTTGRDSEHLEWVSWDLAPYHGKTAILQVIDENSGGWGHILLDQVMFGAAPVTPAQDTSVRLLVDGQVVRSATGRNSEHLDWSTWDLKDLQGRTARIEVHDNTSGTGSGAWAHVLADQFSLSNTSVATALSRARWLDFGRDDYAFATWNDAPGGKRIGVGWMNNWDYGQAIPTSPWRSAMSVPKELSLGLVDGEAILLQKPVDELASLHAGQPYTQQNLALPPGSTTLPVKGKTLDITVTFQPGSAAAYGLKIRTSPSQQTLVGYDHTTGELYLDRTGSGNVAFAQGFAGIQRAPLVSADGVVTVRILVDSSSVEVFGPNGQVVLTDQIFPDPASDGISAFANGGTANLASITVTQMGSARN